MKNNTNRTKIKHPVRANISSTDAPKPKIPITNINIIVITQIIAFIMKNIVY